jgi:hypothetical protein
MEGESKFHNKMKNIIKISIILTFLLSVSEIGFSQIKGQMASTGKIKHTYTKMMIRTAPKLTLEFSGYYSYGIFELSANDNGDFAADEFIKGQNFGVRHGIGGNFVVKIPLHEKGNLRLNISGLYSRFSSKFNKITVSQKEAGYVNYNVFSGGIGIENNFTPSHKIKTLAGISLIGSVITGNAYLPSSENTINAKIKPAFRLGLSVFSGLEYLLYNNLGLNCGYRFTHANLWLKKSETSDNPNEIYLNDKRVLPRIPYSGWKQFAFGSFYAGFNIYFGISEKTYVVRKF